MASPVKLAHIVLWTTNLPTMRNWYVTVLEGRTVHENPALAFITYDDEHHRVALSDPVAAAALVKDLNEVPAGFAELLPGLVPTTSQAAPAVPRGLAHVAFTYSSLGDLLTNYERLKEQGITPVATINHGATTSLYYRDPDGNQVELQIDNFDTVDEGVAFMLSEAFRNNPIGIAFDPDEILKRLRAGEPERELVASTTIGY